MNYRIDIDKEKDSFLPSIKVSKKNKKPAGLDFLASSAGAEAGYLLGNLLTTRAFENATTRVMQDSANTLYESAGRRIQPIVTDMTNANRAMAHMTPLEKQSIASIVNSPFFDKIIHKVQAVKETSPFFSHANALRNFAQASAESSLGELIEKGMKKHTTPWGRFGKKAGLAITGGILAHLIVKKLYE